MTSESRLPIAIFVALAVIIAIPFVIDQIRDRRRPVLVEARIVTASTSNPVFREGRRRVAAGDQVEVALALRIERWGSDDVWLSPAGQLELDGHPISHIQSSRWTDDGRSLRVFWFSVESSNLGGALTAENAGDRLKFRTFLAPEMGRSLQADRLPESHNDDHIEASDNFSPDGSGTIRLYARVEVVEEADDIAALQTVTTLEVDRFLDPAFPGLLIEADLGPDTAASASELFRLPGFEPQGETAAEENAVTLDAFGRDVNQLVTDRIMVSSWTLASTAISGRPDLDPSQLEVLAQIRIGDGRITSGRRPLAGGDDVLPGDLLADGDHWVVLLSDNGNGTLDLSDSVLHTWGRPAERTTLFAALSTDNVTLEHRRLIR